MSFDSEKASTKFFVVEVNGRLHLPVVATCFDRKENETLLVTSTQHRRPCGLMDKAPDFGSGDCRFESCHGRLFLVSQDKTTVVVQNFFHPSRVSKLLLCPPSCRQTHWYERIDSWNISSFGDKAKTTHLDGKQRLSFWNLQTISPGSVTCLLLPKWEQSCRWRSQSLHWSNRWRCTRFAIPVCPHRSWFPFFLDILHCSALKHQILRPSNHLIGAKHLSCSFCKGSCQSGACSLSIESM